MGMLGIIAHVLGAEGTLEQVLTRGIRRRASRKFDNREARLTCAKCPLKPRTLNVSGTADQPILTCDLHT